MEENRSNELLLGTKEVDAGLAWLGKNVKKAGEWYKDASADQEGIGDDILRLLGGGAKNVATVAGAVYEAPVLKQGFQALDALSYYGGKVGGAAARAVNIDPRIGGAIGNVAGEVLTGFGAKAAVKYGGKAAKITAKAGLRRTAQPVFAKTDDIYDVNRVLNKADDINDPNKYYQRGQDWMEQEFGAPRNSLRRELRTAKEVEYLKDKPTFNLLERGGRGFEPVPAAVGKADDLAQTAGRWGGNYIDRNAIPNLPEKIQTELFRRGDEIQTWTDKLANVQKLFKATPKGSKKNYYYKKVKEAKRRIIDAKVRDLGVVRDFYSKKAPLKAGFDRHHLAGLHWSQPFFNGLSEVDAKKLSAFARQFGVEFGDTLKNRRDIRKPIHNKLHVWLNEHAIDHPPVKLKGTSVEVRMKEMEKMISSMQRQQIKLFDLELGVTDLADPADLLMIKPSGGFFRSTPRKTLNIKKTKPTQFPDNIQRHIKRSQEIGITEPSWKDGSIDYIWRPQSKTGQIDIPPQSAKGFKGLRDEFFEQIEKLPSGSVWELNPKFKDEKRRRIYARLFGKDARITRNPDPTLGWVLTVP